MPFRVLCPACKTPHALADENAGKQVRCSKCKQVFIAGSPRPQVEEPPFAVPMEEPSPPAEPPDALILDEQTTTEPVPPRRSIKDLDLPRPRRRGADPDEPPDEPEPAKRRARSLDEMNLPRPRRRGDSDPDEERHGRARKPREGASSPRSSGGGNATLLIIGGVVGLVVLLGCGGAVAWMAARPRPGPQFANRPPPRDEKPFPKDKPRLPDDNQPGPKDEGHKPPPDDKPVVKEKPRRPPPKLAVEPVVFDLAPPPLKDGKEERVLPASVSHVCAGGGGRFLILHLPSDRKLAVFDVKEAKVVKYVPAAADARFAAGLDKLLVALPSSNVLQRWSLATLEREAEVPIPVKGTVETLCMGSASRGPLYVGASSGERNKSVAFLDPNTFEVFDLSVKATRGQLPTDNIFVRASANGRVFGMRDGLGGEPHTVFTFIFDGDRSVAVHEKWGFTGAVLTPSPDGRQIHTAAAVYTNQLELVQPKEVPRSFAKPYLPSVHGDYVMRLDYKEWDKHGGDLTFFLRGNDQSIGKLTGVEGVINEQIGYGKNRNTLTPDQRVFFIPDARVVVTIPASNDRLILHPLDVEQLLEQGAGVDYLVVTSRPATLAVVGEAYRHQLTVKSKKGGVKYRLESGPPGMAVAPDGKLTWDVPRDFRDAEADVLLTVSDASRQETFHSFRIDVFTR